MIVDKQKVEKEAKEILDKFAKALDKVEKSKEGDVGSYVDREEFERVEGNGEDCPKDFKKRMLENAPNHDDDFIIAETGGWK
jgi:predicted Asp-tRNA(Asn)/Glu-tRNA(Gln) amidotransferase subunit C